MANLGNTIVNGILRVTGPIRGNADSASKLQTPRKINGVNFDGTQDITIEAGSSGHTIINSSGTTMTQRSKLKFMNSTISDDAAHDMTIITPAGTSGNYLPLTGGKVSGDIYLSNLGTGSVESNKLIFSKGSTPYISISGNLTRQLVFAYADINGPDSAKTIVMDFTNNQLRPGTNNTTANLGTSSDPWLNIYATNLNGNATSATILQTARTINGTSFNGSANITTANWGTKRNIGIVNSDGTGTAVTTSVNGSANVNLKLPATIKATLDGNARSATILINSRTINGTSFNGSANITTANWGTARTITIGNTGKSVNGSANVTWSLTEIGAAASSHTHSYLPLSGGTLTTSTYNGLVIKRSDTYGSSIAFSNSEGTLGKIGFALDGDLIITNGTGADGTSNMLRINSSGTATFTNNILPSTNNTRTLGSTTYKWSNVYATTFTGALSGNASTATKLQTARTIGLSGVTATAKSFDGSANITIPITAVPASLLTGKSAIKASEINNDKHWISSSDSSVTDIKLVSETNLSSELSGATSSEVFIVEDLGALSTQATSLTCELPLGLL